MKIVVYAICKDEAKFAKRWYKSMAEADEIYVTDTGSTDGTAELLQKLGAKVNTAKVKPWRFDVARNISLSFVPKDADICVCTDLDEVFNEGWRAELEKAWQLGTTNRAKYKYTWSYNPDGSEGVTFWYEKIHARNGFKWVNPVHEVLEYSGSNADIYAEIPTIHLMHHPDDKKSRSQYLNLLELAVKENPNNDRNMHYLGREYMFYGKWFECINTLKKHLAMSSATWADERSASMRYIARAYKALNDYSEAKKWLYRSIAEATYLREGYAELAMLAYDNNDWLLAYCMVEQAFKIKEKPQSYICEGFCWDYTLYDIASISAYNLGLIEKSLEYAKEAYSLSPHDERLKNNIDIIKKAGTR